MSSNIEPPTHIGWFLAGCWGEKAKFWQFSLWPVGGSDGALKSLETPKQDLGIMKVLVAMGQIF